MLTSRPFVLVSALATIAFLVALAGGLATPSRHEAAALGSVVDGMARETIPFECDIREP